MSENNTTPTTEETPAVPVVTDMPPTEVPPTEPKKRGRKAAQPVTERTYKADENKIQPVDLRRIVSNKSNKRLPCPELDSMGYGIFSRQEGSDKPCLWEMLKENSAESLGNLVNVIESFENKDPNAVISEKPDDEAVGGIVALARSLDLRGWINPGEVRVLKNGDLDLVAAARRTIAAAYNYAKHHANKAGAYPVGMFKVVERSDAEAEQDSWDENFFRRNMTPMEEARAFAGMKRAGYEIKDIKKASGVDEQTIKGRLSLLSPKGLTDKEREMVQSGDLPYHKALKVIATRKAGGTPDPQLLQNGNKVGRERVPGRKELECWFNTDKTLEGKELNLKEPVREFIALKLLKCKYQNLAETVEKVAKEAARAKKKKAK